MLDSVERRTREMFGVPAVELGEPTAPPGQLDTFEQALSRSALALRIRCPSASAPSLGAVKLDDPQSYPAERA
jgi:hypothetical protein